MMDEILSILLSTSFLFSIIRISTPIVFATLGSCISEQVSITNIGIENTMTLAALAGVIGSAVTGSALAGLLCALLTGVLVGIVLGCIIIFLKTDVMLGGIALNLICGSGAALILFVVSGDRNVSTSIPSKVLPSFHIPLLQDIPILGEVLSGHSVLTYVALVMIIVVHLFFKYSVTSLRLRSIGEYENAAASSGVNVTRYKFLALALSGLMAGFGGAFLSMSYVSFFTTTITAGRGFIAIAAACMGAGKPIQSALVALLFGTANAFANAIPVGYIPQDLIQMIPYLVTVIGLAIQSAAATRKRRSALARVS